MNEIYNNYSSNYSNKCYFSDDLISYCGLVSKQKYWINYILVCLDNKLEKKWGRYILDNSMKKIYGENTFGLIPQVISKQALIKCIKRHKLGNMSLSCDNSIKKLLIHEQGLLIDCIKL